MEQKPKLEVKQYHGNNKEDYAVFRADQIKPICCGITQAHAEHIKKLLSKRKEIPKTIQPINNWYDFEYIIDIK